MTMPSNLEDSRVPPILGVPRSVRPTVPITHDMTSWQLLRAVNSALKSENLTTAAEEFRRLVIEECDGDPYMITTISTAFVHFIPGPGGFSHHEPTRR